MTIYNMNADELNEKTFESMYELRTFAVGDDTFEGAHSDGCYTYLYIDRGDENAPSDVVTAEEQEDGQWKIIPTDIGEAYKFYMLIERYIKGMKFFTIDEVMAKIGNLGHNVVCKRIVPMSQLLTSIETWDIEVDLNEGSGCNGENLVAIRYQKVNGFWIYKS